MRGTRDRPGAPPAVRRARELGPHAVVPLDPDDLLDQVDLEVDVGAVARDLDLDRVAGVSVRHAERVEHRGGVLRLDGIAEQRGRTGRPHRHPASARAARPPRVTPRATDPAGPAVMSCAHRAAARFEPLRVGAALEPVRRLRMQIETARGRAGSRPA